MSRKVVLPWQSTVAVSDGLARLRITILAVTSSCQITQLGLTNNALYMHFREYLTIYRMLYSLTQVQRLAYQTSTSRFEVLPADVSLWSAVPRGFQES